MTKRISKGTCALCQGEFSRASMTKHLEACQRRAADAARAAGRRPGRTMKHFHVVVEGRELPLYWMHLEVRTGITLAELDAFLRETWLECCGHMSAFEIGGQRYVSGAGLYFEPAPSEHSLRVRLDRVFYPGLSSLYEYDFGTTTELRLKVVAEESVYRVRLRGGRLALCRMRQDARVRGRDALTGRQFPTCRDVCVWGWVCRLKDKASRLTFFEDEPRYH